MPSVPLQEVPKLIREYIGSEQTMVSLREISNRARLPNASALSEIIFLFETKAIYPAKFTEIVSEIAGVGKEKAEAITKEIKDLVLRPIYYALLNWGVDLNQISIPDNTRTLEQITKEEEEFLKSIGFEETETAPVSRTIPVAGTEAAPEEEHSVSLESELQIKLPIAADFEAPPKKEAVATRSPAAAKEEEAPLIIHREQKPKPQTSQSGSKSFSIPFGFFKSKSETLEESEPVRATVETPPEYIRRLKEATREFSDRPPQKDQKRIVHYSELRTPLTPFSKEEQFIDTGVFREKRLKTPESADDPTQQQKEAPKPSIQREIKEEKSARQSPINQEVRGSTPYSSATGSPEKGFVWFKKPDGARNEKPAPPQNEGPRIEGNIVDLRQGANQHNNP